VDGSYAVDVSTDYERAAEFAVRLFDASPQVAQISLGGSAVRIRTTAPGQHVRLTFAGLADQVVTVTVRDASLQSPSDASLGCDGANLDLLSPVGQSLGGMARCSPLSSKRLPADGTYNFRPSRASCGRARWRAGEGEVRGTERPKLTIVSPALASMPARVKHHATDRRA
jgi:hypothetical protein